MTKTLEKVLRKPLTGILISVVIGFLIGTVILLVAGFNPGSAYAAMFRGIFSKPKYISQVIINATPLILTALSVSFAAKTGLFNIGAEGQYIMGTLAAALIGYYVQLPPVIHPIFILLCAMLFGGLWGALAGWLKTKFGIHEVISTIMLNWIALYLNNYILSLPGVKKQGAQASNEILTSARTSILWDWKRSDAGKAWVAEHPVLGDILKTDLHWGILIALVAAVVIWFFLKHTTKGYAMRAVGQNPNASRFAGINVNRNTVQAMFIAGALAALGGAVQIMGTNSFRISVLPSHEGYGWDGLSVSLLAGSNPLGCILSALMFAALKYGSSTMQGDVGAPSEIINIMIGVIVLCIALSSIYPMIADSLKRREEMHA
ncbi:ABC transporter permease [Ruminococcaceae bacterium OttesenSCG-928-D13]|nr:ABC transporter permease [Ruminococcaceae bacterium OttesenSCG-928-D13]